MVLHNLLICRWCGRSNTDNASNAADARPFRRCYGSDEHEQCHREQCIPREAADTAWMRAAEQ